MTRYRVLVIDNFEAPGEGASNGPGFDRLEDAIAFCKRVVDDFLADELRAGTKPAALWDRYCSFGESPLVMTPDLDDAPFSGWDYARARCEELQSRKDPSCPTASTITLAASSRVSATTATTTCTWTFTSTPTPP